VPERVDAAALGADPVQGLIKGARDVPNLKRLAVVGGEDQAVVCPGGPRFQAHFSLCALLIVQHGARLCADRHLPLARLTRAGRAPGDEGREEERARRGRMPAPYALKK